VKRLSDIAMIGGRDALLGFRALGVDVNAVNTREEARVAADSVLKGSYKVVFITEDVMPWIEDKFPLSLNEPVVSVIPGIGSVQGIGVRRIEALVEKAIGVNIFNQEEGK
jgi:V/A-type H+-transporting ATPase subunit F